MQRQLYAALDLTPASERAAHNVAADRQIHVPNPRRLTARTSSSNQSFASLASPCTLANLSLSPASNPPPSLSPISLLNPSLITPPTSVASPSSAWQHYLQTNMSTEPEGGARTQTHDV
ncbi:hypothetical protein NMY22_g2449 [Coprinellus aureogranulatus]|nr:hypothetical protein NMY22_g2449 [Coprinellus aureogranulatus]